jgi:hypothetical protein
VYAVIESNPAVMMGKLVIRGTRITVEHILEKLAADETIDQLLQAQSATDSGGDSCCTWVWGPSVKSGYDLFAGCRVMLMNSGSVRSC